MAAGLGSRYGGLKQMDPMVPGGQLLLDFVLYDAIQAGFNKFVFIIREEFSEGFQAHFDHLKSYGEVHYVYQHGDKLPVGLPPVPERTKPWGTGHAVWCAGEVIREPFTVINADDFYGRKALVAAIDQMDEVKKGTYPAALIAYPLKNTLSPNGTVSRGVVKRSSSGTLVSIRENTAIENKDGKIISHMPEGDRVLDPDTPVSMNLLVFFPKVFRMLEEGIREFFATSEDPLKGEFYLPTILPVIVEQEGEIRVVNDGEKWFGVTYTEDKPMVNNELTALIAAGQYPEKLWG